MLTISQLSKKYGRKEILKNINLSVEPGQIIGLVGENGAGKSTLINIIGTIQNPSSGRIEYADLDYRTQRKQVRKKIGFVPQEIAIFEHLTVKENMLFFEKLSWKNQTEAELKKLCLEMNLTKWDELVSTLSGGMKRKLNLAISLIHEPELLLLDEPTVGIDLRSKQEIANYLKKIVEHKGVTIIYISHDMDEINSLCDKIYSLGEDPYYYELLKEKELFIEKI